MATQMDRLEGSIGGMSEKLQALTETLTANVAKCEACRRVVMGNGGKPIDRRVTRLETAREVSTAMILGMTMVIGAVSSAVGAIVAVMCS